MTKVAIIDYSMGNVSSVAHAFSKLGCDCYIGNSKELLADSDAVVLPGVGAFNRGMEYIVKYGLVELLNELVLESKKPFLGICLGMQLIFSDSEEFGYTKGLSWLEGSVKKISVPEGGMLPHVGWNDLTFDKNAELFKGISNEDNVYFDHSYYVRCDSEIITSNSDYYGQVPASISKDNIHATQFHPEKSQRIGLKILRNFLNYVENIK